MENRLYYAGRFQGSSGYVQKPSEKPLRLTLDLKVVAARLSLGADVSPAVLVHIWEAGDQRECPTCGNEDWLLCDEE